MRKICWYRSARCSPAISQPDARAGPNRGSGQPSPRPMPSTASASTHSGRRRCSGASAPASHGTAPATAQAPSRSGTVRRGWWRSAQAMTSGRPIITARYASTNDRARSSNARGSATAITMAPNIDPTTTNWITTRSGSYRLVTQAVIDQSSQRARKSAPVRTISRTSSPKGAPAASTRRTETRVSAKTKTRSKKSSRKVARGELSSGRSSRPARSSVIGCPSSPSWLQRPAPPRGCVSPRRSSPSPPPSSAACTRAPGAASRRRSRRPPTGGRPRRRSRRPPPASPPA